MTDAPHTCNWCDEGATDRVKVARRRGRDVFAYACREHVRRLAPADTEPVAEPVVEERTEPLCSSCYAEVTWITLPRNGKRMPVDRSPVHVKEPKPAMVLVDATRPLGVVLTKKDIAGGAAQRRIDAGARLHLSHFATCSSAKQHRRQKAAAKAA